MITILFISEDGTKFGLSSGERADLHIRVEIVPRIEYALQPDDVLTLQISNGPSASATVLKEIAAQAGSHTISIMPADTNTIRPGIYTARILLDSPSNGDVRKPIWPKPRETDIERMDPYYPANNLLITSGGGTL